MKVFEFGETHEKTFVMFQCAAEPWWVFKASAEAMAKDYHVYLFIADGHDELGTEFVSIEKNVRDAADFLRKKGISRVEAMYGVSMGGASVIRFLATEDIPVEKAIIDAGITPYPYPKFICRLIALKDWITIMLGTKFMTFMKLAAPPERWTPKGEDPEEHYRKIFDFEKHHFSPRTIYNVFWSTNNYSMPDPVPSVPTKIEYWYGEEEKKARKNDLSYATDREEINMSRHDEIRASYKQLGHLGTLYDGIVTRSTLLGKLLDSLVWGLDAEKAAQWLNDALAPIPVDFAGKLLEVPVGTGVLTMPLYKSLPAADVTCLDYSTDMMARAEKRAAAMNIGNVRFRQGDVGALPFADESFDIVLSLNGFHAFPDKEAAYRETCRVLRKGGIFCGCFYIAGEFARTDFFVKKMYVPKGFFTPPFETKESLESRLKGIYREAEVHAVRAEGIFRCVK